MPSSDRIELLQGTLDMLILKTLLFGPTHGHGITTSIRQTTGDTLVVDHGSLYPALHRLQRDGFISSKWEKAAGKNVISTAVTSLIYPASLDPAVAARLEEACAEGAPDVACSDDRDLHSDYATAEGGRR